MNIILKKIPASTKLSDIADFVRPEVKGSLLSKSGQITNIRIMALHDKMLNTVEYHGLVTVEPDKVGTRVISALDKRFFKDRQINVKEYVRRSWHNDPRHNHGKPPLGVLEKRKGDRRRNSRRLEEITDIAHQFSSQGELYRQR